MSVIVGAGGKITEYVIKHNKNEYEEKITMLENLANELDRKLEELEVLRSRIDEFWKDEKATLYADVLSRQIKNVREARETVYGSKLMYQQLTGDLGQTEEQVKTIIDLANAALDVLGM